MFNTRAEPPLSPAHRAISARSLHRLAAIDLRLAPALLLAEREEEDEEEKDGEEGTRGHTHTRTWHPLSGKEGALALFAAAPEFVAPNCSPGEAPAPGQRTFAEYSTIPQAYLHLQEFYHN